MLTEPQGPEEGGRSTNRMQTYDTLVHYEAVIPSGVTRMELMFECSRNAFQREEDTLPALQDHSMRNVLQIQPQGDRMYDLYASHYAIAEGKAAPFYIQLAKCNWEKLLEGTPRFQLPDSSMEQFLHFNFINHLQNQLGSQGLISYPATMPKQTFWGFWMWDYAFHSISSRWIRGRGIARGTTAALPTTHSRLAWGSSCANTAPIER